MSALEQLLSCFCVWLVACLLFKEQSQEKKMQHSVKRFAVLVLCLNVADFMGNIYLSVCFPKHKENVLSPNSPTNSKIRMVVS